MIDGAWTVRAMILAGLLAPIVLRGEGANVLVYSSLGALATILAYDAARWLFPRRWFRVQAYLSRSALSAPLPGASSLVRRIALTKRDLGARANPKGALNEGPRDSHDEAIKEDRSEPPPRGVARMAAPIPHLLRESRR